MPGRQVHRKLAAILVSDVVGYSRLMGADEEGTLARLRALHGGLIEQTIAKHQGRIVKSMGDGLLVEFASAADAVRCAVEWQHEMSGREADRPADERIMFRIGVNLGDVIIEDDDLYGDGVNIAARMQEFAAPGGIAVSSSVHDNAMVRSLAAFEDGGEHQLKNIARPVRVFWWPPRSSEPASDIERAAGSRSSGPPAVAVLPFKAAAGSGQASEIADDLADAVIALLSRRTGIRVIPLAAVRPHGDSADLHATGQSLGADYVMSGRIRMAGSRCRTNVQMVAVESGEVFWAEQYEHELTDIFALEDAIARSFDAALRQQLNANDARRFLERAEEELSDDQLLSKAAHLFYRLTPADYREARRILDGVIARAPRNSMALAMRAFCGVVRIQFGMEQDERDDPAWLLKLSDRATDLNQASDFAYGVRGSVRLHLFHDHDGAIANARRSLEINPNYWLAQTLLGEALAFSGRTDEGIALLQAAISANERDPGNAYRLWRLALAHFIEGDGQRALAAARAATDRHGAVRLYQVALAAIAVEAGEPAVAQAAIHAARRGKGVPALAALPVPPFGRDEDRRRYLEALRRAEADYSH